MKIGIITYDFYPAIGGQGVESYNLYMHLKDKLDIFMISISSSNLDKHLHVAVPSLRMPVIEAMSYGKHVVGFDVGWT